MEEITLKELFEKYPITIVGLSKRLGKSREWLSSLSHNRLNLTEELKIKHLDAINNELVKISNELKNIKVK